MYHLPATTDVLVVGAGPVGCAAAISLIMNGVTNIVVVDNQEKGRNTSRAVVIHAKTLEVHVHCFLSIHFAIMTAYYPGTLHYTLCGRHL